MNPAPEAGFFLRSPARKSPFFVNKKIFLLKKLKFLAQEIENLGQEILIPS